MVFKRQDTADHRTQYIADITDLHIQRSQQVDIGIRAVCAAIELFIQFIKTLHIFIFVIKDLDDFLAFHHLFNKTIQLSQLPLLHDEVPATAARHFSGGKEHHHDHPHGHTRQGRA